MNIHLGGAPARIFEFKRYFGKTGARKWFLSIHFSFFTRMREITNLSLFLAVYYSLWDTWYNRNQASFHAVPAFSTACHARKLFRGESLNLEDANLAVKSLFNSDRCTSVRE